MLVPLQFVSHNALQFTELAPLQMNTSSKHPSLPASCPTDFQHITTPARVKIEPLSKLNVIIEHPICIIYPSKTHGALL